MRKLIVFGPWCGEFCYELSWWIPEIRKVKQDKYSDWEAIVFGFNGRKVLYKDFTDKYIPYPKAVDDKLLYPATYGEHIAGGGDIIPDFLVDFVNENINKIKHNYEQIEVYYPGVMPISAERTLSQRPYGIYKHYTADENIYNNMKTKIEKYFDNGRETVAIMARIRRRYGNVCKLDWNPEHWETFVDMVINKLKVNVVMIGIPRKKDSSAGGGLTLSDTEVYEKNKDYIMPIVFEGEDSVEEQVALLQTTRCSVYGASGTAVFPFFIKGAPTFTQQTVEEGFRLKFEWERELTDNLKNVKVFDKYHNFDIFESTPEELFEEFKGFYEKIDGGLCYE
jgi:hypothetical protein